MKAASPATRAVIDRPPPLESAPGSPENDTKAELLAREKKYLETRQGLEVQNAQIENKLAEIRTNSAADTAGQLLWHLLPLSLLLIASTRAIT